MPTRSRPGTLQAWLQPPASAATSAKRKRDTVTDGDDVVSSEETDVEPAKKAKQSKAKPKPKPKSADSSSKGTKKPKSVASSSKSTKKLFDDTLKAIDKGTAKLDKAVKNIRGNPWALTTSAYAENVADHILTAANLATLDSTMAFNLLMAMADASHADLDATMKMCGEPGDSSTPTFKKLDEKLLVLVQSRAQPAPEDQLRKEDLPAVSHRWTREDAEVGPIRTGNGPNKQQRNQMYAQKLEWEKDRREERRERRQTCKDWVQVALSDLVEERDYLEKYGVGIAWSNWSNQEEDEKTYLPKCINELEQIIAQR